MAIPIEWYTNGGRESCGCGDEECNYRLCQGYLFVNKTVVGTEGEIDRVDQSRAVVLTDKYIDRKTFLNTNYKDVFCEDYNNQYWKCSYEYAEPINIERPQERRLPRNILDIPDWLIEEYGYID